MLNSFLSELRFRGSSFTYFLYTSKQNIDYYESNFGVVAIRTDSFLNRFFSAVESFFGLPSFLEIKMSLRVSFSVYIVGSFFCQRKAKHFLFPVTPFKLKNTFIVGANFGPFLTNSYLKKARNVFSKCKKVVFRDVQSQLLFADLPNIVSTTDLAFCNSNWSTKKTKSVLFVLFGRAKFTSEAKYDDYIGKSKDMISAFSRNGYTTIGLALSKFEGDDGTFDHLSCGSFFSYSDKDISFIMSLFRSVEVVVSSRHHGCVVGLISNCLVIPFGALTKTITLLNETNAEKRCIVLQNGQFCFDCYSITKEKADQLRSLALSSFSFISNS